MNVFKRGRGKPTGFDFYLHIHTLSPWPSKYKAVYVEWSRGSSHKGVLKPAGPSGQSSGQVASFDFDEGIHVPCTLYTEGGKSRTGALGPFGEKWLVLAVFDYGTKSDKPLGNVHVNLAYYSAEDAMAQQSFTVACSPQISAIVGEAKMLVTIGCKLKGFKGRTTDSASEMDSTDGEYSDVSGFATPGSTVGGRSVGPSSRVSPTMGRIEEDPQAQREAMELRALQESRRRPAGPPAGTPTRQPKQPRYDEDGILEDDDEDEATSPPPQQAAPLPRLQASLPGQLEGVTQARAAAPAPAPRQPNPDADSDEEDFMNAAIAAVEGRGPPPEQVLAEKKASQRAQQSIGSTSSISSTRSGSIGQGQLSPAPDPRSRSNVGPQVQQRSRRGAAAAQERANPPSPSPAASQAVSPAPRRAPAEPPLPAVPPIAAGGAVPGSGAQAPRVGATRWRRTTDESSDGGASPQDVSMDGGRAGGRLQPQSAIPPWDPPSPPQGGRSPVTQDAPLDRAGGARRAANPAPVSPFNEQASMSGDSRASGLSRVSEVTESPGSNAGGGPFAGVLQRNREAAAAAAAAEPVPAMGAPRGADRAAAGSRRPPAPVPASPFTGDDSSESDEDEAPVPAQSAQRAPQGRSGDAPGVGRAGRQGELASLKSAASVSSNPFLQRNRSSDGGEPLQREPSGRVPPPSKSPEPVGASGTARQAVPVGGRRFVRQFPQRQQEAVLSDVQSVLQDAARGPDPPPLTTKPEEPPPPPQPERPTRKLSFYAKPADSQPQPAPAAAAAAGPTPAGGDGVRSGRMQSPVAAGPSPRPAAQSTTTGPLTQMFRGSRQLGEPQPSNFTGQSTNMSRLPEQDDGGRSALLNGRRQPSASDSSDSEDEHIEVIEVDQHPPSSLRGQAPHPAPSPSQPAGRAGPGDDSGEEDEVALAMAAARARRDALSTRPAPGPESGMRPGRMPSPARNQSPALQRPPQPAAPLQQPDNDAQQRRWARSPSPEPVIPLPGSQPTSQSTSRSASPAPSHLPPGAIPGRMGTAGVGSGQNGFTPPNEGLPPPPLAPIPTRLGQNGFSPRSEGLPPPSPPLAPIPARAGAAGMGLQANGVSQRDEPPPWDTPAVNRTRESSPARAPQGALGGDGVMANGHRLGQGGLGAGHAGLGPRQSSIPGDREVQEENPFSSQPPLPSPLLSASPSVGGGSRVPPSFPTEPPRSYVPARDQPPRTVQRSDSLVDRALDMSWSTYNAEAEAPRHRAQLGSGMAAVSEGGPRRQDSEEVDNGPAADLDAPAAPLSLPNGMTVADVEAMLVELRTVAALEASVYLARSGKGGARSLRGKAVHAPARRVARTTIMLGPEEGVVFGVRAIRAIEAAADGCSDVVGMAYWWSNCIQLRWMLWAMCHGGGFGDAADGPPIVNEFDWVMKVLVPPLKDLECYIFENINTNLWSNVLVETAMSEAFASVAQSANHSPHHPRISQQELAIHRWHDALAAVNRTLVASGQGAPAGHVELLKQKVVTALLRRLDSSLFAHLVQEDQAAMEDGSSIHRDHFGAQKHNASFDTRASSMKLDSKLLPFPKGPLTFGVGINLKMAVTRWTNWASDIGIKEDLKGIDEGYSLFPRLRATADLLMMPKEVLTDRVTRSEVVPGLPLRRICQILERFEPDDFAPDALPAGLLDALHQETPPSQPTPSPAAKLDAGYEPPSESSLLADGLIEPVSLELDDDSDDELDAVSEMYDSTQAAPESKGEETQRFQLLKELWSSAR